MTWVKIKMIGESLRHEKEWNVLAASEDYIRWNVQGLVDKGGWCMDGFVTELY